MKAKILKILATCLFTSIMLFMISCNFTTCAISGSLNGSETIIEPESFLQSEGESENIVESEYESGGKRYQEGIYNGLRWRLDIEINVIVIIGYEGSESFIEIPSFINGIPVVGIENGAFKNNTIIKGVVVGENVTYIGDEAFKNCTSLISIVITINVVEIGVNVFDGINVNVYVSHSSKPSGWNDNWINSGSTVIWGCGDWGKTDDGFIYVHIHISITIILYVGDFTFVEIPNVIDGAPVVGIGNRVFENNTIIKGVVVGENVTYIGDEAFKNCTSLISIVITINVVEIGVNVFDGINVNVYVSHSSKPSGWNDNWINSGSTVIWGCGDWGKTDDGFIYVHIHVTITIILYVGDSTSVVIPDIIDDKPVDTIGGGAFSGNSSITDVTIGNNVTTIKDEAFKFCISITIIVIPSNVTIMGSNVFIHCTITVIIVGEQKPNGWVDDWNGTTIPEEYHTTHIGGEATCQELAICTICQQPYGEFSAHVGGTATCKNKAICTTCNNEYGSFGSHNMVEGKCTVCGSEELAYVRDGEYIYFGEYPQSLKEESVTITSQTNEKGYYKGSDGEWYAKVVADTRHSNYVFSNGSTYYFKVEPIKWRILESDGETAFILCESIIANKRYDDSSNNYANSEIRAWLNNEFLNTAFSELEQELILTTLVDNSASSTCYENNPNACENTYDKVFLLSYQEVVNSNYFSSYKARCIRTSAYARATGVYISTSHYGYAIWWLRSPHYNYYDFVFSIYPDGIINRDYVDFSDYGVLPALKIQL